VVTKGVDTSHGAILYLESLSVSFDGFKRVNDLTLTIDAGELRCVIGPNGAGKTPMMDVITGKTRPDTGYGLLRPVHRPHAAVGAEIAISDRTQVPEPDGIHRPHRVREPELAKKADKRVWPTLRAKLDSTARDRIATILDTIKLTGTPTALAGLLSHGQKRGSRSHVVIAGAASFCSTSRFAE
jgi:urea transport system ATP-binding protein